MATRTPTPQSISALLKRAGFTRADSRSDSGFAAGKIYLGEDKGAVRVRHYFSSMGTPDAQHRAQLERYAEAITEAGYAAEIDDDGRRLIVTAEGKA
jgi:hypothetical protein